MLTKRTTTSAAKMSNNSKKASCPSCAWWLMKTEPHEFAIDDLKKVTKEPWTGVRNYQVRNFMRDQMTKGDKCFIYHSNTKIPGIVGVAEVVSDGAFPDPTQFDSKSKYYDASSSKDQPRWWCVNVGFVEKFKTEVSLEDLKTMWQDEDSPVVRRGNRLSVSPVLTEAAVKKVLKKGGSGIVNNYGGFRVAEKKSQQTVVSEKKESGKRRQRDE